MATHSSVLALRIPYIVEPGTVGYSPWGLKELDMTEPAHTQRKAWKNHPI